MPGLCHGYLEFFYLRRTERRTSIQRLVLSVICIYLFHRLLGSFQPLQFLLQLFNCMGMVCTDASHARTFDLIQNALHLPPFFHVLIPGSALLFLFSCWEICGTGNHNRWHTGVNLKSFVHVICQFPGIGIHKCIYFSMVNRIDFFFLLVGNLHHLVYTFSVFCFSGSFFIVGKTVHLFCPAHHIFTDWVIDHINFLSYCQLCISFFHKIKPATRPATIIPTIIFFFMAHLLSVHSVRAGENRIPRICI